MKKTYTVCDVCEIEIDDDILIPNNITFDKNDIDFDKNDIEIILGTGDDICIYCFIKAVKKLDRRPVARQEAQNETP